MFQGLGCSPIKAVRELGSERRETVRSISGVGVRALRGPFPSTRGPGRTHLWCTSYRAHVSPPQDECSPIPTSPEPPVAQPRQRGGFCPGGGAGWVGARWTGQERRLAKGAGQEELGHGLGPQRREGATLLVLAADRDWGGQRGGEKGLGVGVAGEVLEGDGRKKQKKPEACPEQYDAGRSTRVNGGSP
ncbi:unnamed protein product [Prunus armeniaca]|uniref:Uncharacterized protein n=1 Tax=Prunus armeniaca TaxID=36596 RepID=A0A6J5U742_PRUAR|nr:unnamed protein product [Prunus armeniaca]